MGKFSRKILGAKNAKISILGVCFCGVLICFVIIPVLKCCFILVVFLVMNDFFYNSYHSKCIVYLLLFSAEENMIATEDHSSKDVAIQAEIKLGPCQCERPLMMDQATQCNIKVPDIDLSDLKDDNKCRFYTGKDTEIHFCACM